MHSRSRHVLFTGNLLLDKPLQGLYSARADQHDLIRDATLSAFENLVAFAVDQPVEAVVFNGRMFVAPPTVRGAALFRDGVETLLEAGVSVYWAGPQEREWQTLSDIRCLPHGLQRIDENHSRRSVINRSEQWERSVVCEWLDMPRDHDHHTNGAHNNGHVHGQTRIGLTRQAIGHLTQGAALHPERDRRFDLIVSGAADRSHTTRSEKTIYHAPGCLQPSDGLAEGPGQVTMLRIDVNGELELLREETSVVRREQRDLLVEPGGTRNNLLELAELELQELAEQLAEGSTQLLQLEWIVRGPVADIKDWSSEELAAELTSLLETTEQGLPVNHHVQLVPLMSGQPIESDEFVNEQLEEQFLQHLGGQLNGETSDDQADRLTLQLGADGIDWRTVFAALPPRETGHRSGEWGVRALQQYKRA